MPTLAKFSNKVVYADYSEASQSNPIRWTLYKQEGEELVAQTKQFRCKDYLNDIVAWYHGKTVKVYGMDTSKMEFNDFGVFVRLGHVYGKFLDNFSKVVAPIMEKEFGFELKFVPLEQKGAYLTLFPRELFNSTYTMSKLTFLIRCCNRDKDMSTLKEMLDANTDWEYMASNNYQKYFNKETLLPPEEFRKYWWFAHSKTNSESGQFYGSVVHDNGVYAWEIAIANTQGGH